MLQKLEIRSLKDQIIRLLEERGALTDLSEGGYGSPSGVHQEGKVSSQTGIGGPGSS